MGLDSIHTCAVQQWLQKCEPTTNTFPHALQNYAFDNQKRFSPLVGYVIALYKQKQF